VADSFNPTDTLSAAVADAHNEAKGAVQARAESMDVAGPDPALPEGPTYVYAIGRVEARFPTLAVEKEYAQVAGREAATAGLTDRQAVQAVLSERQYRYLARKLCWVFTIEGVETYLLFPQDPADLDLLLEALRPTPSPTDVDVVIGMLGPVAPPEVCNGLMLPIVVFDQIYSFDIDALVKTIPRPEKISAEQFEPAAEELLSRIMQIADNGGATDADRALNYLAVRDPSIYEITAEAFAADSSLIGVEVRPSRLSGSRNISDVIFTYASRQTGVEDKYFARVDLTEEFPFLVSRLSPFFER